MTHELTLKEVREKITEKNFRASDFLTEEQVEEVHKSNAKGKKSRFSVVDAYIAEIIARFGYDAYVAWKAGDITEENMVKFIEAERAREASSKLALEAIIVSSLAGAQQPTKSGHAPRSLRTAIKILEKEQNKAKGDF
jgi:hypothetical protein